MGVMVAAAVVIAHLPCSSRLAFGASATFKPAFHGQALSRCDDHAELNGRRAIIVADLPRIPGGCSAIIAPTEVYYKVNRAAACVANGHPVVDRTEALNV